MASVTIAHSLAEVGPEPQSPHPLPALQQGGQARAYLGIAVYAPRHPPTCLPRPH
ncbi:hypothetical protein BDZ90DRAFT_232729 [Jaminaea rosea]|uniref:Uncharacterized protein n=1 Tax=Jaminaea rosea TaxID=1569628 RepID=A0A316UTE0_9BASI|nr:hypothetical protein BDZ90DRAFT_232729 [Jaminaea rosea]PWN27173.1 hypothetical protein BDZ90DRAFT_232729 [Jaminaea rosea]